MAGGVVDIGAHLIAQLDVVVLPGTMGQSFEPFAEQSVLDGELAQKLKKAVGFRNIAVHNYEAINWHVVHALRTCT